MNIVQSTSDFLQLIQPVFQKKVHKLLEFGFKTVSLQRIVSLNSNARSTVVNRHTAESKVFRLTKTNRFLKLFPGLVPHLKLVEEGDCVAIDFSDFGGFMVLQFAKRTDSGRALPLYFEILEKHEARGFQNTFIINAIKNFFEIIKPVKVSVSLVFDRGFACPSIIEFLAENKHIFYIRIKGCKTVFYKKFKQKVQDFIAGMYIVKAYDRELSLTVTPAPPDRKGKPQQPWYIISNDVWSTAKMITDIYYHRFEIEEFFRDAKRIFGLEYIHFKKVMSLAVILWFVILNFWLQRYLLQALRLENRNNLMKKCKDSFNQSWTHYLLERIKLSLLAPALSEIYIRYG
jgi:hypothetical protein